MLNLRSSTSAPQTAIAFYEVLDPQVVTVGSIVMCSVPGVWGFAQDSQRVGVVRAIEPSRYHGCYFTVELEGINIPRRLEASRVIGLGVLERAA